MENALELKDVCFCYDDGDIIGRKKKRDKIDEIPIEKMVLKHLSLEVPPGQFLCLVGHSGCGKTTLLRNLAGLNNPTEGEVCISGHVVDGPGLDRSVVFQNYSLFPWMTVTQNIEFGIRQASAELGRNFSKEHIREIVSSYLEKVNMVKAADLKPFQLSGGMQQRVAIARALAMDTEILLFDEPFGALDIKTRRDLQDLMQNLWSEGSEQKTAVFVTHDIDEALLLADRVVFMSGGVFGGEFFVQTPRPRDPDEFAQSQEFYSLKSELLELFYSAEEMNKDQAELERVYDGSGVL